MDQKVQARLKAEIEAPGNYKKLLGFSVAIVRRSGWRAKKLMTVGEAAEDLLHEAVLRAFDGRRSWPTNVDVVRFLHEAMRSIISAGVTSPENETVQLESEKGGPVAEHSVHIQKPGGMLDEMAEADERVAAIYEAAGSDSFLLSVVEAIMDGEGKAARMASTFGVPVTKVYEALRKLRRRAQVRRAKEGGQ